MKRSVEEYAGGMGRQQILKGLTTDRASTREAAQRETTLNDFATAHGITREEATLVADGGTLTGKGRKPNFSNDIRSDMRQAGLLEKFRTVVVAKQETPKALAATNGAPVAPNGVATPEIDWDTVTEADLDRLIALEAQGHHI